ncbi:unnamed protein product [Caenorhabditis auriculariae]|uniref:EB domain-containing protein n=1 Tax=Caenorhabditis auriculariae TaxID=2777116 RepID=A0A8S1GQZ5_9PELO|nr:unnamed protein product [Caenorhabditis auriculariae]
MMLAVLLLPVLGSFSEAAIANYYDVGSGVQTGGSNPNVALGSYCISDANCGMGQACTPSVNGVKICLPSNGGSAPGSGSCSSSSQCPSGQTCTMLNGVARCEVQVGGYVPGYGSGTGYGSGSGYNVGNGVGYSGKLNETCTKDADCNETLSCTKYYGKLLCRPTIGNILQQATRCRTESDCPHPEFLCVFSTALHDKICYKYGETITDGYVIPLRHIIVNKPSSTTATRIPTTTTSTTTSASPQQIYVPYKESQAVFIGDGVELANSQNAPSDVIEKHDSDVIKINMTSPPAYKREEQSYLIDPAASVCEFDYQCRMGESCSAVLRFVDRNVTTCQYDVTKQHRQCVYHSDCLSGQRCMPTATKNLATCEPSIAATLGEIGCFYDFDCSGGEKCTLVDKEKKIFRCRPSTVPDPRRNQLCSTNSQCPFQQVCRRATGIAMCVDVTASENPSLIQEKVVQFVRDFLFRTL